jgi:hypothetical protein
MPPRYAYWTILVDGQPTAFRAGMQDDLMPTFKRLKEKHPSAEMKWFQNGRLWTSRLEAQESMRERGERGRQGDARQGGGFRDRKREGPAGDFGDRKRALRPDRSVERPEWKPRGEAPRTKLEWSPKGDAPARSKSERKPGGFKSSRPPTRFEERRPPRPRDGGRPEWKPKASAPAREKAERQPKGSGAKRDRSWRPGGDHKDPRQKYKDAKKAKWQRFKKAIRTRWDSKQGPRPLKKRRDDEDS